MRARVRPTTSPSTSSSHRLLPLRRWSSRAARPAASAGPPARARRVWNYVPTAFASPTSRRPNFARADIALDPNDARLLNNRTEGWVIDSTRLDPRARARGSLRIRGFLRRRRPKRPRLPRERRARDASLEQRRFLLHTSILERLSGPLCDAVLDTTGSAALLDQLERANLFLVPLEGRNAYRYHPRSRPCSGAGSRARSPR